MKYSLKTYSNLNELDTIKEDWAGFVDTAKVPRMVENDLEYFKFQISEGLLDGDPLVFALFEDQKPVLIASGKIETVNFSPSLAYFKLNFIKMLKKCYHIFPYGIFGRINSEETIRNFINAIMPVIKKGGIDYIFFNLIPGQTELAELLLNIRNPLMRDFIPLFEEHYILQLPDEFETFLSTRNTNSRQKFRRLMRRVDNDSTIKIAIKVFTNENDIEFFFENAEQIAQKSQLRALNVGFKATPTELKRKKWLAANRYLRGYMLYVNDTPGSFVLGNNYKRNFYLEYTGTRIEYEKYQLGTYLYIRMIEDIINTGLVDTIDFTHGSDLYKKILSSDNIKDIRVKLYIPKVSNIYFITNITFNTLLNKWGRTLLRKTGLYDQLRRTVRKKLKKKIQIEKEI